MRISYHLKESISSSRKVFRLFRFFDEIKGLAKMLKSTKPLLYKILSAFTYLCSCFYYISDNTLWTVGVLIMSGVTGKETKKFWKKKKNIFSLFRVIAYLIILLYSVILQNQENEQHSQKIVKEDDD